MIDVATEYEQFCVESAGFILSFAMRVQNLI